MQCVHVIKNFGKVGTLSSDFSNKHQTQTNNKLHADYTDIGRYYCQGTNYISDMQEKTDTAAYQVNKEIKHTVTISTG